MYDIPNLQIMNKRIKELRQSKGISVEEMANRLKIPVSDYVQAENDGNFRAQAILDIAYILDCDPEYIYYGYCNDSLELDGLTEQEKSIVLILRSLKESEKNAINNILDAFYYRTYNKHINK